MSLLSSIRSPPPHYSECSCYLYVTWTNSTNYILHKDWAWELVLVFYMLPVSPFKPIIGVPVEALPWELLPVFFILPFISPLMISSSHNPNVHNSIHFHHDQVLPLVASSSRSCSITYSRALLVSSGEYALLPSWSLACCCSPTY